MFYNIINTIGSVDQLIEKYKLIIEKIREFRKYYFSNIIDGTNEFEIFSSLVRFEGGSQPPKDKHIYKFKEGYIRFIQNRDYSSNAYLTFIPISKQNKICDSFDIMTDKYGEAGKIRYGIDGAYNVALMKITPQKMDLQEYIRDFLSQKEVEEQLFNSSQASTRPSLSEATYLGLKMPMIKAENLILYEKLMKKILKLEFVYKNKISSLRIIKEKLLQKYF